MATNSAPIVITSCIHHLDGCQLQRFEPWVKITAGRYKSTAGAKGIEYAVSG